MAELERRGDRRGLADAYLLSGDHARARTLLDELPASADRESDLAAAALLAAEPESALTHANRAIAADPKHAQAWWNRGLALRDLDLPLAAAVSFERSAELGKPAWAAEAKARAEQLRVPVLEHKAETDRLRGQSNLQFLEKDPLYPVESVARHPGHARRYFYRAARAALSADDVRKLGPIAQALDRVSGTKDASRMLEEVAAADFDRRRPLVEKYRALMAQELDAAGIASLIAEARRAGAIDLLLPAQVRAQVYPTSDPPIEKIVRERGDRFFVLSAAGWKAYAQLQAGELAGAEITARAALAECRDPWAFECALLENQLANIVGVMHRPEEARLHALGARRRAEALRDPTLSAEALVSLAQSAWLADRRDLALGYAEESALRDPSCHPLTQTDLIAADIYFRTQNFARAREHLRPRTECDSRIEPQSNMLRIGLARMTNDPGDLAAAVSAAEAYAAGATSPGEQAAAKIYQAASVILRDRATGTKQVEAALRELRAHSAERDRLRSYLNLGYELLLSEATAGGDFAAAARAFEEEAELKAPEACAVYASLDDDRAVALVRGKDGTLRGELQRGKGTVTESAGVVPAAMVTSLAGCEEIAVLARPPLHGRTDLLPSDLSWYFLSPGPANKAPPPTPRGLLVTDVVAPPELGLPRLLGRPTPRSGDVLLSGKEPTPSRVLSEMAQATYVEVHAHGLANLAMSDASFLALSPEAGGRYALTAGDLAKTKLAGAPTVVLAACRAAEVARYLHERWSLPDAFLRAGARTVFAATQAIPDDGAATFFAALRARLEKGEPPARALRDERVAWMAKGHKWVASVILFQRP
jgi:hypothetical protein